MNTLRQRLLLALGAAAAGCEEEGAYREPDAFFGPYEVADSGLPVFPQAQVQCPPDPGTPNPGCSPCCETFACYLPEAGERCVDAERTSNLDAYALLDRLSVYPDDLCRLDGPFDPQAAGWGPRACCYVAGTMLCSGRPLLVTGALRVAELAIRADWN